MKIIFWDTSYNTIGVELMVLEKKKRRGSAWSDLITVLGVKAVHKSFTSLSFYASKAPTRNLYIFVYPV